MTDIDEITQAILAFRDKIMGYRRSGQPNPVIGCIVLTDPVFLEQAL